jgi:hypothetical protein
MLMGAPRVAGQITGTFTIAGNGGNGGHSGEKTWLAALPVLRGVVATLATVRRPQPLTSGPQMSAPEVLGLL